MKRFTVQVLVLAAVLVAAGRVASGVDATSLLGRLVRTATEHPVRVAMAIALATSAWRLGSRAPPPERRSDDASELAEGPTASAPGLGLPS